MTDHILHGTMSSEGFWSYRLECIGDGHHSWTEKSEGCTCTCAPCLDGEHSECEVTGGDYIEEIGYECQCERSDICWTTYWLEELGGECISGNDWPEDALPCFVRIEYDEGLVIRYADPYRLDHRHLHDCKPTRRRVMEYDGIGPRHCTECGHDHQGARLGYICIGCPCNYWPDDVDRGAECPDRQGSEGS